MGVYSSFASNLIKSGKIVAFEPNPFHINILHKNIGSNTENYEIYNMALGREKGVVKITPNLSSGSNIKEKNSKINIKKTSIKNMVKKGYIEKPNIVKIDVEGSELDVIRGFKSIIKEVNVMYVEVHRKRSKKFGYKEKQIMDILNENFGGVWKINEIERSGGKQVHVKAK
jgi:FkbM family methyltransferase